MNVEKELVAYLAEKLDVPVSADVPPVRPASFVTVEAMGGNDGDYMGTSDVAVQCWAATRAQAAALAWGVRAVAKDAADEVGGIVAIECDPPSNLPQGSAPRYQFTAAVTAYDD